MADRHFSNSHAYSYNYPDGLERLSRFLIHDEFIYREKFPITYSEEQLTD